MPYRVYFGKDGDAVGGGKKKRQGRGNAMAEERWANCCLVVIATVAHATATSTIEHSVGVPMTFSTQKPDASSSAAYSDEFAKGLVYLPNSRSVSASRSISPRVEYIG